MPTGLGIAAVVALILANGWFVAMEFAFVAARRGPLQQAAEAGDRRAARAVDVHKRLSFMLSGAQLGITVTSLVVGFLAEPSLGRALEPVMGWLGVGEGARLGVAFTVAFVVATVGQMVFGELAPKNLAIAKPEPFARALAGGAWGFMRLASPLIRFFDSSANALLRVVGIEPVEELRGGVAAEELDLIVEESARHGSLGPQEAARLARAIDFWELQAADAMVPRTRVVAVDADASGRQLRQLLAEGHSRFPVVAPGGDLDDVVGVVHARDLLTVPREARDTTAVEHIMRQAVVVPETVSLEGVLTALRQSRTELAVVVDEYGGTAGIITLEDLVEELVGEIADEHDPDVDQRIVALGDHRWAVPGWCRLDEVARDTGVELPAGDYSTVGGLIMARLGRIPRPGDRLRIDGAALEVSAMKDRTVTRVIVERPPDDGHDGDHDDHGDHGRDRRDGHDGARP